MTEHDPTYPSWEFPATMMPTDMFIQGSRRKVAGLNPQSTPIDTFISLNPVACREDESLDNCERLMQEHQVRRIPIVDGDGRVIGIVSQADLALKDNPEKVAKTVAEVSKPRSSAPVAA
jgi:CBS-domain-containing membrane protein